MGAIRDFLDSVGRTKTPYTGVAIPGPPPADTASAEDKAKFDESVRKYQLDRRAYEQYNTELNNRLRNFNPYADPQYRVASTTPPSGATSVSVPTPAAPTPPTQLRAPTYGAISQFSNLTPQQQGELYLQQRGIGYTDEDIRKATAAQVGTPSEEMMANIYKTAYPQYTQAIESQYGSQFNRSGYGTGANQIDYPGFNYYINQLSTGAVTPDTLESAIRGGAAPAPTSPLTPVDTTTPVTPVTPVTPYVPTEYMTPEDYGATPGMNAARGGYINRYAHGGEVRTHYQRGGRSETPADPLEDVDAYYRNPATRIPPRIGRLSYQEQMRSEAPVRGPEMRLLPIEGVGEGAEIVGEPPQSQMLSSIGEGGTIQPLTGPTVAPVTETQGGGGGGEITPSRNPMEAILARYLSGTGDASRELAAARQRSQSESEAFYNLIRQMSERGESPTSRAEMYFRLASAFGAPTRTGHMGETLSRVGEQMGEYTRGRQADERERRGLLLRAQEARMGAAREDLATTRALAAQEGTERAGIVRELVKEYVRSGEPQTEAEKEARALGLVGQEKADFIRRRIMSNVQNAERRLTQLEPGELKTYNDNRELVDRTKIAIDDLRRAIALNPRTIGGGLGGRFAYGVGSAMGSEAEIIQNTDQLKNILGRITVDSLKATFPGAISNAEREALERLSGATSSSIPSRERIMRDALRRLETMVENAERRMSEVQTRANRNLRPEGSEGQSGGR